MADWLVLIHQLPPDPPYLRAKIAHRLTRIGALALKNAVYVLPRLDACLEDLQWIAQEATASGGMAFIAEADWRAGVTDKDLRQRFSEARTSDYRGLVAEINEELAARRDGTARLAQLRQRLAEIVAIDWFAAPGRQEAERLLDRLDSETGRPAAAGSSFQKSVAELRGLIWVTRPDVYVDRIATAWLVRRFVDPRARFRFSTTPARRRRAGEITFDLVDGDLTHEGERCTYQVLLDRLGLTSAALRTIGEIVADIDFKEPRHGHPETAGIERLLNGVVARHARDLDRLEKGAELFDSLYAALSAPGSKVVAKDSAALKKRPRVRAPDRRASVSPGRARKGG